MALTEDDSLHDVKEFFLAKLQFAERVGEVLRRAFDEAIMGPQRGHFELAQLNPTEKAYIGLRIQLLFEGEFELAKGDVMDFRISGHEVDMKFSLTGNWTIPPEAIDQLCLLVSADEDKAEFSVGLMRMSRERLRPRPNRDRKCGVSAAGKAQIRWLVLGAKMPPNFFLGLKRETLDQILHESSGQRRVTELFRVVQNRIIPRIVIPTLALQDDPMKRARDARKQLKPEGISVLCGAYLDQREQAAKAGYQLSPRQWLSIRVRD